MTAGTPVTVSISILKPGHRPAAPTNLGVSASNAQLDLTWNASVGATDYEVHYTSLSAGYAPDTWPALDESEFYRYRPGNGWVALPHTGTTASQTISGLTNGTAYRVRVRAKNAAGVSDWVVVKGTPGGTPPATMSFAVSTLRVVEGNPVPDLEVKLSRPLTQALSIPITTKRGSAEVGDYVRQQNSVTIPAGETSASFTSWARAAEDDDKDNETVTVSLPPDGLSGRVVAGNPSSVTVTIVDDDVGGGIVNVSFAEAAMELCEGGPQKYLPELMLSRRPDRSTTIWLTGDRGTAEPNDHTFLYVGYIGIQRIPYAWHASPYAIRALPDAGKAFEQFTVEIDESRLPDGFWAVEPKKVTVTIIDDDLWRQDGCNIQPPRLSVKGDRGVEWSGGGWIDFTVSIDRDNREPFTVEYSTEDVTAVAGQDYTAKTGTLSFGPYQRSQEVRVHILDDDVEDSGETFRLVLSNPNGAVIENGVGIGTILNDDGGEVQLTAAFEHAPARHDGSAFWFDLRFNEPLGATANTPSAASFTVKNGSIDRVWKVEAGRWRLQVAPETRHDVTLTLAGGRACDAAGTVCTVDGRALSNSPTATVAGPDGVLSADANLSGLTAEAGADGSWTALDVGTFAAATTTYTASVENATTHVRLTATAADTKATLKAGAGTSLAAVSSGTASGAIALAVGANALKVEVTAEDGTVKTYTVTVTRQAAPAAVAVSLSATPNPVGQGSAVTVTATLAKALSEAVTVPLIVTRGTSEDGDHGSLASITIPVGGTSATGTITTVEDADGDDETFTVALGSLPAGLAAGTASSVEVTITDKGAQQQQRTDPLTAAFEGVPSEHDGTAFTFDLTLSEAPGAGNLPVAASFKVAPGKASVSGSGTRYTVTVTPKPANAWKDVKITLAGGRACGEAGAVCTADGRALSNSASATIGGPVRIRIEGAKAKEGKDESLDFAVTLNRAAAHDVSVDYATKDETAAAGADYTATSGTLTFAAGETAKTISVPVLDDAIDEGKETMRLLLSNPQGAYLRGVHSKAKGVIRNEDPLQAMWLARFGRMVASDAVASVTARLETPRDAGSHVTFAGQRVNFGEAEGGGGAALATVLTGLAQTFGAPSAPAPDDDPGSGAGAGSFARHGLTDPWNDSTAATGARRVTGRELLLGSSFRAVLGQGAGSQWTSWGQGASVSRFSAAVPGLDLSGESATGSMGMDYERGRLLMGFAMTHSVGEGTARDDGWRYALGSTATTMLPYARLALTDRVSAWGLAGTGSGTLSLDLDGSVAQSYRTDLAMTLAAAGVRGDLVKPAEAGGFALALKADAFWVRTESDRVTATEFGNLSGARGEASRVRAVLDGSRTFALASGATLAPSLELGLRRDGGDAETGTGLEFGGGLGYADPSRGLDMALKVHGLAVHAEDGYDEWGVSGQLRLVPGGAGRGLSASLTPSWGVDPSGSERLWALPASSGLEAGSNAEPSSRLDGEVGYGMALFGNRFTGTPNVGFGMSDTAREYRMGWRLTSADPGDPGFEIGLAATRREAANDNEAQHGVMLKSLMRW